ncbi:MAG: hypothetical protein LUE86_08440 [Clostridiales bacterium]|nr:hypothetical protein [Clostridiales bacterium]
MALKNRICPDCGRETQINDEKPFSFCRFCGYKIILPPSRERVERDAVKNTKADMRGMEPENFEVDKKLQEVAFYYQLSREKNEAVDPGREPEYYLKGQDILADLTEQYPEDYRIWWEFCKPVDFYDPASGVDTEGQYFINKTYFDKALDKAPLSEKRKLVVAHDQYNSAKERVAAQVRKKRQEEEQRRIEEEQRREAEERRKREEQEKKRLEEEQERENQEKERRAQEEMERIQKEQNRRESIQAGAFISSDLWDELKNRQYSAIDNTYFPIELDKESEYIGVFKDVSKVMYLMAFKIDSAGKKVTVFREQTMSIKFGDDGKGLRFNNAPIKICGKLGTKDNMLTIAKDAEGNLHVNGVLLQQDPDYVASLIKRAKKPLLMSEKVFL